jgi:hypothetical protein
VDPNRSFGTEGCGPCVALLIKYKTPQDYVFCAHIDHGGEAYQAKSDKRKTDADVLAGSLRKVLPTPQRINGVWCATTGAGDITELTIACLEKIYGTENLQRFQSDNLFIRKGQVEFKEGFDPITSPRTNWVRDGYLHLAVNPFQEVQLSTEKTVSAKFLTVELNHVVRRGHWGVVGLRPGILFGTEGCVGSVGLIVLQTNMTVFCAHIDHNIEPDFLTPAQKAKNKQSLRTSLQLNLPPPHHVKKFGVITLAPLGIPAGFISEFIVELIEDIYKNKLRIGPPIGKCIFITGKGEIKSGRVCDLGTERAEEKDAGEIHVIQGEKGLIVTD